MHTLSLIGLPVSSMSVVASDLWLKLVIDEPKMVITYSGKLNREKYIIIDTGIMITEKIKNIIHNLEGSPAITKNSLFLRVRCIAAIKPLLSKLGPEWTPKSIIQQIPSLYFYKAIKNRQQRADNEYR